EMIFEVVLLVIILVILLRGPEGAGGDDKGGDRLAERRRGGLLLGLGRLELRRAGDEDRGPVAVAPVAELAAGVGRIDGAEVVVDELGVSDLARVVGDFDRLIMAGAAGRYLLVGRMIGLAAGETGHRRFHPRHLLEVALRAPEAAAGEHGGFELASGRGMRLPLRHFRLIVGRACGQRERGEEEGLLHGAPNIGWTTAPREWVGVADLAQPASRG